MRSVLENTKIEWATHTQNTHHGCTKVDPGCFNCYAETMSERWGKKIWGPLADRQGMADNYWKQLDKWNRLAEGATNRPRVFCNSMSDVFEGPETCQIPAAYLVVEEARERLFDCIIRCPNLDFLLLTKRPENMIRFAPQQWGHQWPSNVWAGASASEQNGIGKRMPELCKVPAVVRFLSIEPLLGPVDLTPWMPHEYEGRPGSKDPCDTCGVLTNALHWVSAAKSIIDWVIIGGESGAGARPMHPDWARSVRDQCVEAGVPVLFKQWGEWGESESHSYTTPDLTSGINGMFGPLTTISSTVHGEDGKQSYLIPTDTPGKYRQLVRLGKKRAGRVLDGRTWDQFPVPR